VELKVVIKITIHSLAVGSTQKKNTWFLARISKTKLIAKNKSKKTCWAQQTIYLTIIKNKAALRVVKASIWWNEKLGGIVNDLQKLTY